VIRVCGNGGNLGGYDSRVGGNGGNLGGNESQVGGNGGNLGGNESRVGGDGGNLGGNESQVGGNGGNDSRIGDDDGGDDGGDQTAKDRIIALITLDNNISIPALANNMGISKRNCERIIAELKKAGVVSRSGSTRSGCWIVHNKA
jgi:hypothetical protein